MFSIENHGSIVLIRPLTDEVAEWMHENTDGQWFGDALAVEHRYVEPLVQGMIDEGFDASTD